MKRIVLTLTLEKDDIHVSQIGTSGVSFDTGENGLEINLAIDDLALHLRQLIGELE